MTNKPFNLHKVIRFAKSSRWLSGALISIGSILIIAFWVDWPALPPILDRPAWWMVMAALFFYFNALACRALILRELTLEQPSYSQSLFNLNEGSLINILMPLHLGDNGRAFLLARKLGVGVFPIRAAIRVERLFDAFIVAEMLIISLLISAGGVGNKFIISIVLILLTTSLFSLPLVGQNADKVRPWVIRFLGPVSIKIQNLQTKTLSLLAGMNPLSDRSVFGTSLFWCILAWAFRIAGLFTLIRGVAPHSSVGYGFFAAGILAMSGWIPSGPAGMGVYELAIVLSLNILGIDPTTGLACALISHLMDVLLPLTLGGVAFLREGETIPGLYKKLAGFI